MNAARTALVFAVIAAPALAASPPAPTPNAPLSSTSSNITPSDTHSTIAPILPVPDLSENAPPRAFLEVARRAIAAGRTGEAQEALERAESRALDRSVRPSQAGLPSKQSLVAQIAEARSALSGGDRGRAIQLVDIAANNPEAVHK